MRVLIYALFLLFAITPQASIAQDEVLSQDLRQMSEREAERQARRDLNLLLTDFSGYKVGKRKNFQGDIWFWTDPRANIVEGLCERDLLQIFYEPTNSSQIDFTVKASTIAERRYYGFTQAPTAATLASKDDETALQTEREDRKCRAQLKEEWAGWFTAANPMVAVKGYLALAAARDAVSTGLVQISECEDRPDGIGTKCQEMLNRAVQPFQLSSIDMSENNGASAEFRIDVGSIYVTIETKDKMLPTTPANIKSVKLEPYIVI